MRYWKIQRLMAAIFPNYSSLEPCVPTPRRADRPGSADRSEISHVPGSLPKLAMPSHSRSSHHGGYERRKRSVELRRPRRRNGAAASEQICSPRCSYSCSQSTAIVSGGRRRSMAHATVAFTDLENREGTGFPNMSESRRRATESRDTNQL